MVAKKGGFVCQWRRAMSFGSATSMQIRIMTVHWWSCACSLSLTTVVAVVVFEHAETYHMIDSCDSDIAGWNEDGLSFIIRDVATFADVSNQAVNV